MNRLGIGAAILAITLLNFFQFPGHTWLQSDTQIYMPILERMWDPSALRNDLIAQHPHVGFTLYDETAIALRRVTGLDFRHVLEAEQFVFRVLGIWGAYLIATALGLSDALALLAAAVFSLGATIMGPAVLVFEYEPVPRGLAVPLVFLAIGLVAHERFLGAGAAVSAAFLFHPPTVVPFCAAYLALLLWPSESPATATTRRKLATVWVLLAAALVLLILAQQAATPGETRAFFTRLDPRQEELQRLRAPYNWVSLWWSRWLRHYLMLYAVTVLACWRLWKDTHPTLRFFLVGLPLVGVASVPASYLLLERWHWALIPEFQPTRALLFVVAFAMLLATVTACKAAAGKRWVEALVWLALAYLVPANRVIAWPSWKRAGVVLALSLLTVMAIRLVRSNARWWKLAAAVLMLAPFFMIPTWGGMENYPALHDPELAQLVRWAAASTSRDAVFLFPDADQDLYPGIFRGEAVRAVYVDWKSGGQVNFFKELGEEWWKRWQQTMAQPFNPNDLARYRGLGVDYAVLQAKNRLAGMTPVFENARFAVYALSAPLPH